MEGLYFDSDTHSYYYQGEKKDCVSDILKIVDVIAMEGIPQKNIEKAAERGTAVHKQTEDYDYGLIDTLDDEWIQENFEIVNYVIAYENFTKDYPSFPIASEESVYSQCYEFAGTIDLVKYIDGKIAIIDKKSSKTISALRSALQLNAYRLAWNEIHPDLKADALYILQLTELGEYRLLPIDINEELFIKYLSIFKEIKGDKKI